MNFKEQVGLPKLNMGYKDKLKPVNRKGFQSSSVPFLSTSWKTSENIEKAGNM